VHSDHHKEAEPPSPAESQLTPTLMAWAQGFNVEGEEWILEGELQTLRTPAIVVCAENPPRA